MNIEGLGEKILETFHDIGLISDAPSIFKLKKEDIEGLEGFGEKSAENIIASINSARDVPLHRFLYSLGIRHVGEQTAKDIAKYFFVFKKIQSAKFEELSEVEGVGEKVAESLIEFFSGEVNQKIVNDLLKEIKVVEEKNNSTGKLKGLTFAITGSLPKLSRDEAKDLIEKNGGKVAASVSKSTNYLLAGDGGGSKRSDAEKFGIKIISELELVNML